MRIELDSTAIMMLDMLRATIADEPPVPDAENWDEPQIREAADKHYDWHRRVDACHVMLNARLRNLIEDQLL